MDITAKEKIGHGGGYIGVRTLMYFNAKTKIGKVLFVNTEIGNKELIEVWRKLEEYENKL